MARGLQGVCKALAHIVSRVEKDKGRTPRLADCDGPPQEEHQVRLQGFEAWG